MKPLRRSERVQSLCGWLPNEAVGINVVVIWLGLNALLFVNIFLLYSNSDAYIYTRIILGPGLAWARASAMCLNLNCMLILLPVSRNLISFLRGSCTHHQGALRRQLDKSITFHRMVSYLIVVHTIIHVVAHLFNIKRYHEGQSHEAQELLMTLSSLGKNINESYLNPIRTYDTDTTKEVLISVPGLSGVIMTVVLILMITSSTKVIRKSFYEIFWFTHHLFVVFFIGLVVHGVGGIVRGQTSPSLSKHNASYCKDHLYEWGNVSMCPLPEFAGNKPVTWRWVIVPLIIYICERILRYYRSMKTVVITKVVTHPSDVIEVQMKKKDFRMEPGQYVYLQCPQISHFEWHPFTLTSAPEDDYFSVHVRVVGDWTNALKEIFLAQGKCFKMTPDFIKIALDGPYGSASTDVFDYRISICIAAGIGVTPFASVLKSIWYKCCDPSKKMKLQKIYFFWICRDTSAFEWFADLLHSLEVQLTEKGKRHFLSYHIFLTGWSDIEAAHIALHCDEKRDVITGLQQKTFYGRPNWNAEFRRIADSHPCSNIGVFSCGPKSLSRTLSKLCNYFSSADPRRVHFHYNKERF
ncbi:NADPH oxidase 3-like [Erpetoichthys calabaricus]|uniref:NADPH oxidase 3-like n=1 Tax=Erpetoichthys calabaricus TaxID=27687 RepID=UPI0022346F2B|nr:NADPH oxidase 3-like [Erpetoichthys calabaricus]